MLKKLKSHKGFTLIEMLVVIVILGVLVAIAVPAYIAFKHQDRKTTTTSAAVDQVHQVGLAGLKGYMQNDLGLSLDLQAPNHLTFTPNEAGWVAIGDLYTTTSKCRVHLFVGGKSNEPVFKFRPYGNNQMERFIRSRQDVINVLGC